MEINGLNELSKTLENSKKRVQSEGDKILYRVGNKLLRKVKLKTPVGQYSDGRTGGTLRRSWRLSKKGDTVTISNNVEYAQHVEFGHRTRLGTGKAKGYKPKENGIKFVEGRYMLTKSVEEIEKELSKEFDIMLENLWK